MYKITSNLVHVQEIANAGRGVLAKQPIPTGTLLLESDGPAAHVVHWQYRKEVCAQCFRYNLGRTLPVKHASTGKVFCSPECQSAWMSEQGELAIEAWEKLYGFVALKANTIVQDHVFATVCARPDAIEIEAAWSKGDKTVGQMRQQQTASSKKKSHPLVSSQNIDPDILGFLLSGLLLQHHNPNAWEAEMLPLAADPTPYTSNRDLEAHVNSYIQLAAILPHLTTDHHLTSNICRTLISTANHNAFGLRSADGDEYLGYGVYPSASYFNHSCSPNISKQRVGAMWEFRAARDIAVGEQCCITYLGGDEKHLTVLARRARLESIWGFECACPRCLEEDRVGGQ
ncbi:hypothetical protein BDY17DRAFT_304226 [Neohortaea acidophila]|uniref:SET domain-containing protein n=1 Tax=Neohortaea acidophila TaxID=245834 RepID=A0A6A6PIP4_9PEZI|nr:uncharacterized protein BDY17DRAFT_304226 [Neohortaea acidophila]KAF2479581.1 hypothetical protein BDY17DRAFT_304226 [Neohortaea acidophila]